jgi:hypothetical protein
MPIPNYNSNLDMLSVLQGAIWPTAEHNSPQIATVAAHT